jgi:NTE family protein
MTRNTELERRHYAGSADLVLAGGGVKGIAHVGALKILEAHGYRQFPRVVGTSVGALVGALVAAGVPAAEIEELILEFNFRRLRDPSLATRTPLIGRPLSLLFKRGAYKGDKVREWLAGELGRRGITTFGDLRTRAVENLGSPLGPRDWPFVVLATDIASGRLVRLPEHYPRYGIEDPENQLVADAVRASLSIPIFYRPFALHKALLVDGGVLSNYAIGIFDAETPAKARWPTFGMTLLGECESATLGRGFARSVWPLLGLVPRTLPLLRFAEALVGTAIAGQDQGQLDRPGVACRTIRIDTDGFGVVDFEICRQRKEELIACGRRAASVFMKRWEREPDDGRAGAGPFPLRRARVQRRRRAIARASKSLLVRSASSANGRDECGLPSTRGWCRSAVRYQGIGRFSCHDRARR